MGRLNRTSLCSVLAALLVVTAPAPSAADTDRLPMWRIAGEQNDIYLLGSVHLLRESDYPIPQPIYTAYSEAETLIMELDMDDLDPMRSQALVAELGLIQDGRSLRDWMGPERYDEAEAAAEALDIELAPMAALEPWLVAISVDQLMLARVGFDPAFGIENHLLERATADQKEILGLEELSDQLELLDGLSLESQRDLLMQTFAEANRIGPMMDDLIAAWRRGDTAFLEREMLAEMQDQDELYQALVVQRNRNWVTQIHALLDDQQDYLIIVGALHLVGDEGVPEQLRLAGVEVVQMTL